MFNLRLVATTLALSALLAVPVAASAKSDPQNALSCGSQQSSRDDSAGHCAAVCTPDPAGLADEGCMAQCKVSSGNASSADAKSCKDAK